MGGITRQLLHGSYAAWTKPRASSVHGVTLPRPGRDRRAAAALELHGYRHDPAAAVALHHEVQMRPRAEPRVSRVRDVLAAIDTLAGHDANRVPVQVSVERHRAVVVQYADDVRARAVLGRVDACFEEVARDLDHDAGAR